jgi:ribosome maturation factor RimP
MNTERLRPQIEAYLDAEGIELDDLALRGRGRGRILRVTVDADGGVDVDRVADLSRGLSRLVDDEVDGPFTLEVTSPGLERELRRPSHYRKSVGREVVITTREPVEGSTSHRGVLNAVGDEEVTVQVGEAVRSISFDSVAGARTVFRWERAPKPGRK